MRKIGYWLFDLSCWMLPVILFKHKNTLRVIAYHTVEDQKNFERQILYLKSKYSLIDIYELQGFLYEGKGLPKNPLLITFDDGDVSVYHQGFPVLKKYSIPAVLFIITQLIDSENTFWCRQVEMVFKNRGKTLSEARNQVKYLKKVSETDRKKYLRTLPMIKSNQLNSRQLIELHQGGMYIGNHTHTHPMIDKCSVEEITWELNNVKSLFEKWNLEGFSAFAYPNGNFNSEAEKILRANGIKLAFLFDHKMNEDLENLNPMRISRIRVNSIDELPEFKTRVSGLHPKFLQMKQRLGNFISKGKK